MRRVVLLAFSFGALIAACGGNQEDTGARASGGAGGSHAGGSHAGGTAGSGGNGGNSGNGGSPSGGNAGAAGADSGVPACTEITTFADGLAPTKIIHVSTTGSDTGDGSSTNPLKSIAKAAKLATPGTEVRVHAGTYPGGGTVIGLSGTAAAPIWIGGAPGEPKPVIDGAGEALYLSTIRYVVIHDLEVQNTTLNGINMDDGDDYANIDSTRYVVFQNLDIHDVGGTGNQDCLKLSGVNDYVVLDSSFARCGGGGYGSGIDQVGCHHGLIARSRFADTSENAVQTKGGSLEIEIRECVMQNAGDRALNLGGATSEPFFRPPLSTTAPNYEAKNIRAIANLIIGATAAISFTGCVDCLAANNTIVDPGNWILRILQSHTTNAGSYVYETVKNGRFENNLVYFSYGSLSTYVNIGTATDAASFQFVDNLWYAHDDPSKSAPTNLPAAETGGIYGQDPGFQDATNGDYHIDSTSPAAGKGASLSELGADLDGHCYRNPPSIGGYETP